MGYSRFIAKRLLLQNKRGFSAFIARLAVLAIAISTAIMLIATSLVSGFQQEIAHKAFGFFGHLHVTELAARNLTESSPLDLDRAMVKRIAEAKDVKAVYPVVYSAGILGHEEFEDGIALRGVDQEDALQAIKDYIIDGDIPPLSDSVWKDGILLSKISCERLNASLGDTLRFRFSSSKGLVRYRNLSIIGIYNTGLYEIDEKFALCTSDLSRSFLEWSDQQVSGYEIFLDPQAILQPKYLAYLNTLLGSAEVDELSTAYAAIDVHVPPSLTLQTMKDIKPSMFNWLSMMNTNEIVILFLMLIVAAVNMITAMLCLILDRTKMIGLLKALGSTQGMTRRIFLWKGLFIVGLGIVLGNAIGLGLAYTQIEWGWITLPEKAYYVSKAPLSIDIVWIVIINCFSIMWSTLVLFLPLSLINRIQPVRALRFA